MANAKTLIAFDLYGTLLSTESVARKLAGHIGGDSDDGKKRADEVAATWRRLQLEYTWRLNSMGVTQPFSHVTESSLRHALAEHGLPEALDDKQVADMMAAYDALSTFPDVGPALKALGQVAADEGGSGTGTGTGGIDLYVFSNGTESMVNNSVRRSPDLAPHAHVFGGVVSVEPTGRFKPHPNVYHHLARQAGRSTDRAGMAGMWLISGNPFDVVGARSVGMNAIWVDRKGHHSSGQGWTDRLVPREQGPTAVVKGLDEVLETIQKHNKGNQ